MKPRNYINLGLALGSFILTGDPTAVAKEIRKAVASTYSGTDWSDIADNFG